MTTNLRKIVRNNFALVGFLLCCSVTLATTVVPAYALPSELDNDATPLSIEQDAITAPQTTDDAIEQDATTAPQTTDDAIGQDATTTTTTFPVQGTQKNDVVRKGYMETSFALESDGTLNAVTRTWTNVKFAGFTGGVIITLTNADGIPIWATDQQTYGVDGTKIPKKKSSRTENWQAQVPPEILSKVKGYAILQEHTPRTRVLDWITSSEAQQIVKAAVKYFGNS